MANKTKTSQKAKSKNRNTPKAVIALLVCFLIIGGTVFGALHYKNSSSKELINLNKNVAYGIDVSYHNGKINWKTVKNEVDFAFIRVGYRGYDDGLVHLDSKARTNLKNANKNGVPIGVYFYSQATNEEEAIEEADFVLKEIKGYDISLPVVIDFEYPTKNGKNIGRLADAKLNRKEITNIINAFCEKTEDAGYVPGMYASSYIYKYHINVGKLDNDIMIWVADYNDEVTYSGSYDFWQFSDKGKCKGVSSKYVDTNYWYTEK